MLAFAWIVALVPAAPPASAADAVTLRDGQVILGQVLESDRRGPVLMLARRGWLDAHLPNRAAMWRKAEAPTVQRAVARRRERLTSWRRDRLARPAAGDRILAWIDRELARLGDPNAATETPLMVVRLNRAEIKETVKHSRSSNRALRLGWLSGFTDVETLPKAELEQALEGRGFASGLDDVVSIDTLLPPQPETDAQWLTRRASTELAHDPGGRLLRYQGLLLDEPAPGEAPPAAASLEAALAGLKGILGNEAVADPLPAKLAEVGRAGRVGAVVTRLEMAPDFSSTRVEAALWVRAGERWVPALARSATVRPEDLPPGAGDGLAEDPQVKAAFGLVESLGLGQVSPELKGRSLGMGAATRKALGQARGALDRELQGLAFSLNAPREAPGPSKP